MKPNQWMGTDISPENMNRLVLNNWDAFAAFAWDRYKAEGRGMVRFDFQTARHELTGETGYSIWIDYFPDDGVKKAGQSWPLPDAERIVREYDPEEEVVFLFITPSKIHVRRDSAQGRLTPRAAYEAGLTPKIMVNPDRN